jgi:hypothetical protein
MKQLKSGILSGLIATIVLSVLMILKKTMGVHAELDPIHTLAALAAAQMGISSTPVIGWVMHFGIGAFAWGGAFAIFNTALPGNGQLTKGLVLGLIAWVLMMVGLMPITGDGFFGSAHGPMTAVMTLALHVVFGLVLGKSYEIFTKN